MRIKEEKHIVQILKENTPITASGNKPLSNEEELHYALLEQSLKHDKWEKAFNDWNLLQSKEMVNITSQVIEAKQEVTTLSQKRDLVREEIA